MPYGLTKYKINHYLRQGDPLEIIEQFNSMKTFLFNNSTEILQCEGTTDANESDFEDKKAEK